jgi:hypothetical protein
VIVALSTPDIFVLLLAAVGGLFAGTVIRLAISRAARRRKSNESDSTHQPIAPGTPERLESSSKKEREGDGGAPPADTV